MAGGGVRRKVDERVVSLMYHGLEQHQRSFFVVIGPKAERQALNIYELRRRLGRQPSVCWCYKRELGFKAQRGLVRRRKKAAEEAAEDPFWLFQQGTKVTYCRYRDSARLMGSTFDFLVLQDFEALTPNVLCRAVETVAGGGVVVLALKKINSLKELLTLDHDLLDPFKSQKLAKSRYCERFVRSLTQCKRCICLNDQLEVLPLSQARLAEIQPLDPELNIAKFSLDPRTAKHKNLDDLLATLSEGPVKRIVELCVTRDQATTVSHLAQSLLGQKQRAYALLANRGRGKSAAIGLCIAVMVASKQFKRIALTAPAVENVSTAFDFLCKGLAALGVADGMPHEDEGAYFRRVLYGDKFSESEPADLDLVDEHILKAAAAASAKHLCEVECHLAGGDTAVVEYVPLSGSRAEAEIVFVDEAASVAIPALERLVRETTAPLVITSTVDGYEGTGFGLTEHILKTHLPQAERLTMAAPIRYARRDALEHWLRGLLCLPAF